MRTKTLLNSMGENNQCFDRRNLQTQSVPLDYHNWPIKTVLAFIIARNGLSSLRR